MNKIIISSLVIGVVLFAGYSLLMSSEPAATGTAAEIVALSVTSIEVKETEAETNDGGVYAMLANGETRFIAQSDPRVVPVDPENSDTYRQGYISPDGQFVAVQGVGFEDTFVQVYAVKTDVLHEKIAGEFTSWSPTGLVTIEACNLAGENCVDKIEE